MRPRRFKEAGVPWSWRVLQQVQTATLHPLKLYLQVWHGRMGLGAWGVGRDTESMLAGVAWACEFRVQGMSERVRQAHISLRPCS